MLRLRRIQYVLQPEVFFLAGYSIYRCNMDDFSTRPVSQVELASVDEGQACDAQPVLPNPWSFLISAVAATGSIALDVTGFVAGVAIEGARVGTVAALELARVAGAAAIRGAQPQVWEVNDDTADDPPGGQIQGPYDAYVSRLPTSCLAATCQSV